MKTTSNPAAIGSINSGNGSSTDQTVKKRKHQQRLISRRSFLGRSLAAGAGTIGVGLLGGTGTAEAIRGGLTPGDAALLRFPAALELLEADFWIQYNELGGIQDDEVPGGSGNPDYTEALEIIEDEMQDYIHDNTDDEITHHTFLNAYLASKGAPPADLDPDYTEALEIIEDEMQDYIHDNTDDEITHHTFLNAYLASKGAPPADLD